MAQFITSGGIATESDGTCHSSSSTGAKIGSFYGKATKSSSGAWVSFNAAFGIRTSGGTSTFSFYPICRVN